MGNVHSDRDLNRKSSKSELVFRVKRGRTLVKTKYKTNVPTVISAASINNEEFIKTLQGNDDTSTESENND